MTGDRPPFPPDRQAAVEAAAMWLVEQPATQRPIPAMKEQFRDLTTVEACAAIGRANALRRECANATAK